VGEGEEIVEIPLYVNQWGDEDLLTVYLDLDDPLQDLFVPTKASLKPEVGPGIG